MNKLILILMALLSSTQLFADNKETCRENGRCSDLIMAARLSKNISNYACVMGRDWGVDENKDLWVDHGCQGEFEVVKVGDYDRFHDKKNKSNWETYDQDKTEPVHITEPVNPGNFYCQPGFIAVYCNSEGANYKLCPVPYGSYIGNIQPVSNSVCNQNSFGLQGNSIWVNNNCSVKFCLQINNPTPVNPTVMTSSCNLYPFGSEYYSDASELFFHDYQTSNPKFWTQPNQKGFVTQSYSVDGYRCVINVEYFQTQVNFVPGQWDSHPNKTSGFIFK